MKLIIGQIQHETNTFSNVATTEDSFKLWGWNIGDEMIRKFHGVRSAIGGMIDRAEELGIQLAPTFATYAQPSGIITSEAYEALLDEMLTQIEKAGRCDAICLSLHGAGVVQGIEDFEGELMGQIRQLVGYEIPLIITLDLHANMTERMVRESNAIFGDNYYPHIDSYDRGIEAVNMAVQIFKGEVRPVMHLTKLPLMIPTIGTQFSPIKEINEACQTQERTPGLLDCTLFHGFPFSDIAQPGVSVLATSDNDPEIAKQAAEHIASMVWNLKDDFYREELTPAEGIRKALQSKAQPIVINEMSDNPGGGAPGDGTRLLSAMLDAGVTNACFAPMYDPEVAHIAHKSGVGTMIQVSLGGKTDQLHGDPLPVKAYVKSLTDGRFIRSSPMGRGREDNLGKSARLLVDGVDIVVCSVRSQLFDEQLLLLHGIDVSRYKIIALKSSHHFRAAFENICDEIISVDSPGLCTLQFADFPFRNLQGDIYPISPRAAMR